MKPAACDWQLADWLAYIESLHPSEIELGLERVERVADNLGIDFSAITVVTVAGTNGKGSCVALLEGLLAAGGQRTGAYTSPHLQRYNERIRIAGVEADDEALCRAFTQIEQARGDTSLTYFEFGTLAAFLLFKAAAVEIALLEVGMGGRLDAVNVLDADIAIITSIDIDHSRWLGATREAIGKEKAGIIRSGKPVICLDRSPPASVLQVAGEQQAVLYRIGRDFELGCKNNGKCTWSAARGGTVNRRYRQLSAPLLSSEAAAGALLACSLLELELTAHQVSEVFSGTALPGRFEQCTDPATGCQVILDVAHNPAAAARLARRLQALRASFGKPIKISLLLAIMADKDSANFVSSLASAVDFWYISQVNLARCLQADKLAEVVHANVSGAEVVVAPDISDAMQLACGKARPNDLVVVCGSFFTVSAVRDSLDTTMKTGTGVPDKGSPV